MTDTNSTEPSTYATAILFGLGAKDKHVYEGTVPAHVKAHRRTKNRVARKSRRANRGTR